LRVVEAGYAEHNIYIYHIRQKNMQLTTRALLTPYAPILYTLLKENVHAMRLALRGKANGFYMLPSIE